MGYAHQPEKYLIFGFPAGWWATGAGEVVRFPWLESETGLFLLIERVSGGVRNLYGFAGVV